ncbi:MULTISPECIES: right-handed parallel beta-helix repeat-containing protein [unclassified Paenibacillus]|uniref:right-handed parallel beta-helix repeat-containing protein n=1 Tax=unclassified Paenibacillus TaxID=185978 RepID=UPI002379F472|nr:right-handed parallel beta-helix repeat-containing protein [Paenibacillus sp. MAHUQ-63]
MMRDSELHDVKLQETTDTQHQLESAGQEEDNEPSRTMTRRSLLGVLGAAGISAAAGGAVWSLLRSPAAAAASTVTGNVYGRKGLDLLNTSDPCWVNVLDYGAAGDGIADDTNAFVNAAATGKPMIVPKPTAFYKLSGPVALTASIIGIGMPEIQMSGSNGSDQKRMFLIHNYQGGGLHVTGLYLNGGYTTGTADEQSHLVRIANSVNVFVHNNMLHAPYGDCVYIGSSVGTVYLAPSENVHILDNVLSNPRRCAVAVVSGRKVWISGNVIKDPFPYVATIDLEPNSSSTGSDIVEDIWIANNEYYSEIYFINSYNPNTSYPNKRITITGNKGQARYFFRCNSAPAITEQVTIKDNDFYGSVSDARMIQCSNVTKGLEISGNRDYATGAAGWNIANTAAPIVAGNRIESSRAIAVSFTNCSSVQFTGNLIKDINSSNGAVRFAGPQATGRHLIAGNQLVNIGSVGYWFGGVVTETLFDGNVTECAGKCVQIDAAAAGSDLRITTGNVFAGTGTPVFGGANLKAWTSPEIQTKDAITGWAAAAPVSGTWKRGSILWNAQPSVLSPTGWICVSDGTPGVWEPIGSAGALSASSVKLKSPGGSVFIVGVTDTGQLTVTPA